MLEVATPDTTDEYVIKAEMGTLRHACHQKVQSLLNYRCIWSTLSLVFDSETILERASVCNPRESKTPNK